MIVQPAQGRDGSKCEELNVSKSGLLYPAKRTSARRAASRPRKGLGSSEQAPVYKKGQGRMIPAQRSRFKTLRERQPPAPAVVLLN
jgi:hypothetical protein